MFVINYGIHYFSKNIFKSFLRYSHYFLKYSQNISEIILHAMKILLFKNKSHNMVRLACRLKKFTTALTFYIKGRVSIYVNANILFLKRYKLNGNLHICTKTAHVDFQKLKAVDKVYANKMSRIPL